jgi:hypothetical protein
MHAFHAIGEMTNVRNKVRKLKATPNDTPIQEKAFKIDTTAKFVAVQVVMIFVLFGGSFLVFSWLELAAITLREAYPTGTQRQGKREDLVFR